VKEKPLESYFTLHASLLLIFVVITFQACKNEYKIAARASSQITAEGLLQKIRILASDEFEGRAPATRGETLTVNYLIQQYKELGLNPGNPNGSFVQQVPLLAVKTESQVSFVTANKKIVLRQPQECIIVSRQDKPEIRIDKSEMIFVGYGIIAPEFHWDDYKNVDVKGKTVVILINDPPIPDPRDPSALDPRIFGGKAMTYYGRWTYKYEMAAQKGAAAAIIIHETGPAGYPYEVVINSREGENFALQEEGARLLAESWITERSAIKLFAAVGINFEQMKHEALDRNFKPKRMGMTASFAMKNRVRRIQSQNVIAKIEGTDPDKKNDYLVYTAHWDHLGKNENLKGDQIFNGAQDNASGTAGMLEIAKAYAGLKSRPRRSILFLSTTCEEKGLLGAEYYVQHPLHPIGRTVADINIDSLDFLGRTNDITVIGLNDSPIHVIARRVAAYQGRRIQPDPNPEKGLFFRSDHFPFAKRGIQTLFIESGNDVIGKPAGYAKRMKGRDYHKVSDEVKNDWNFSGAVEDLQFLFMVGHIAAFNPR
jgi:Zn-dependent M28 family amino/carboxypeptidase